MHQHSERQGSHSVAQMRLVVRNSSRIRQIDRLQQQVDQAFFLRSTLLGGAPPDPVANEGGIMQRKLIMRKGKPTRVPDDYVLQDGEYEIDETPFTHHPQVIFAGGKKLHTIDEQGNAKITPFNKKMLPGHKKLQAQRLRQGQELARRIRNSPDLAREIETMRQLARSLELMAGNSVPQNHEQKIKNLLKKNFSGSDYRKVIPGQDELTQSRSTTEFFRGVKQGLGVMSDQHRAFLEQALRAFSSLRAPTATINAPIMHNGQMTGQQHPTSGTEKLPGGGSGHSYADRMRVLEQIQGFNQLGQDPSTSATMLVVGNLLSALVSTLSTMSFPNTAVNVPDFQTSRTAAQHNERGRMKMQTGLLKIKLEQGQSPPQSSGTAQDQSIKSHAYDEPPPKKRSRRMSAPVVKYPHRAASPMRFDDQDSDVEIIDDSGAQSEYDSEDDIPVFQLPKHVGTKKRASVPDLSRANKPPKPQFSASKPLDFTKLFDPAKMPPIPAKQTFPKVTPLPLKPLNPGKTGTITGIPPSQTGKAPTTTLGNKYGFQPFPHLKKPPPPPPVPNVSQVPPQPKPPTQIHQPPPQTATQPQPQVPQTMGTLTGTVPMGTPLTGFATLVPVFFVPTYTIQVVTPKEMADIRRAAERGQLYNTNADEVAMNRYVQTMADLIRTRVPADKQDAKGRFDTTYQKAMAEYSYTVEGGRVLRAIYQELYQNYRALAGSLRRRLTQGNDPVANRFTNQGRRFAALEQYFNECGQMAVHNVLALEQWSRNGGNFMAMVQDHAVLNQLGGPRPQDNFQEDLDENQLRAMLARAGQQGIPVVGNLGQLEGFIQRYNMANALGGLFNLPQAGAQALHALGVHNQERQGIDNLMHFLYGRTDNINIIINTQAHAFRGGVHWIAVRLVRFPDGRISLEYLDSVAGAHNYQHLFIELRNFINRNAVAPVVAVTMTPVVAHYPNGKGGPGGGSGGNFGGNGGPGIGGGGGGGTGPISIPSFG
ncbi:MAG: hypothetical protein AAGN35_06960 [Bacteroidota bacterium]